MREKEILNLLKKLRKIRPEKNWAFLKKREILGENCEVFPFFKPIYALMALGIIFAGVLEASQRALPGEPLYFLKKQTERAMAFFLPKEEKPKVILEVAKKRVEELSQITQKNEIKKLPVAMKEAQASVSEAAKILLQTKVGKEEVKKALATLQTGKKVEEVLQTEILPQDFEILVLKKAIEDLEKSSLTKEDEEMLKSAKEALKQGNIEEAFLKVNQIGKEKK